jgi:NAD+ kinase
MPTTFNTIGLIGRVNREGVAETLETLIAYLQTQSVAIVIEQETGASLNLSLPLVKREQLGQSCDLIISVGGDGSLLSTARIAAPFNTPILGINRGKFGFLTDIRPNEIAERIGEILTGKFKEEKRSMLQAKIINNGSVISQYLALNDVIIAAHDTAHMLEFEIHVNNAFMCSQQSDGVIIATPTGSTAYALSGGGPIVSPSLNAIVMVPMFPHSLSQRPIVLNGDSVVTLTIPPNAQHAAKMICDGQDSEPAKAGSIIEISKYEKPLRLIHPLNYHYFETLRGKLHWGHKLC